MITLTKEWLLKTIAELEEERDATPGAVNEDAAMSLAAMKIALASLEARSRKLFTCSACGAEGLDEPLESKCHCNEDGAHWIESVVYTAPPAPVSDSLLSELLGIAKRAEDEADECAHAEFSDDSMKHSAAIVDWERRAAMLQGVENAEQTTTMKTAPALDSSPKIAESPSGINQGKSEPVTTACKLRDAVEIIRKSGIEIDAEKIFAERDALNAPDCWCRTCRPVTISDMRFVVCPECGNKRCPHANDHRNACTGSNEPGQEGSAYPAAPQQEAE